MDFFNNLDGRIFEYSLSALTDNNYLFDPRPGSFYFSSWAVLLGIIGVLFCVLLLWWFKKRRDRFYVNKQKRKLYTLHLKISLGLWIGFLLFVFLRTQGLAYLSMRLWSYLLILGNVVNLIIAVIKAGRLTLEEDMEIEVMQEASVDNYAKYLPRKKKK
jgi:uncharacterized iron-regulated membrane protein